MRCVSSGDIKLFAALLLTCSLAAGCGNGGGGDDDGGTATPGSTTDGDGDGFTPAAGDCNDSDATVNAAASEVCDGKDNDCDGETDENADLDGDGYISASCTNGNDCNDADAGIHPGVTENCDGKDNDCNGRTDDPFDADGDGAASSTSCSFGTDCNDSDPTIATGKPELCDGKDNDCNGKADETFDVDGDGYSSCSTPGDCNDTDPNVNPGALEILDGADNDCKGGPENSEFDLYYADMTLAPPLGFALNNRSVDVVGDVNGDGYDDFVVGMPSESQNPQSRGYAYLVMGKATPVKTTTLDNEGFALLGVDASELAGFTVARAGDLNGDGFADIAIGAPRHTEAAQKPSAGAVYILFGKSSGWSDGQSLQTASVIISGDTSGEEIGTDVAGLGDCDGDGLDDLVIGAQQSLANPTQQNRQGKAYLMLGRSSGWTSAPTATSASTLNASWIGEQNNSLTGSFVGGAGDINGDGLNDILVGSANNSQGGPASAKTYIIFGRRSSWAKDETLAFADASMIGSQNDGSVTVGDVTRAPSARGVGDIDNDGFGDFIVTAPNSSGGSGKANNGKAYLYYGKQTGWKKDGVATTEAGAIFNGEASKDNLGTDIAALGDVNFDGFDDFAISASANSGGGVTLGKSYILLGRADRSQFQASGIFYEDLFFYGGLTGKIYTGEAIAGNFDYNNDGYLDYLVSAQDGTTFVMTDLAY